MYKVDDSAVADSIAALPSHLLEPYLELPIGPDREMIVCFGKWADPQRVVVVYEIVF